MWLTLVHCHRIRRTQLQLRNPLRLPSWIRRPCAPSPFYPPPPAHSEALVVEVRVRSTTIFGRVHDHGKLGWRGSRPSRGGRRKTASSQDRRVSLARLYPSALCLAFLLGGMAIVALASGGTYHLRADRNLRASRSWPSSTEHRDSYTRGSVSPRLPIEGLCAPA